MWIRPAVADDAPFLLAMLREAVNWEPDRPARSVDEIAATPELARYAAGWPLDGDVGVVAEDQAGAAVGAAWFRFFDQAHHGYGFVASDVPEVTVGVVPERRGTGVGRALLDELHRAAGERGIERLSLSVERANPARRLYERLGYEVIGGDDDADTMVVRLG